MTSWEQEVGKGQRFGFGENWARFLHLLNDGRIKRAEQSLRDMLGAENLAGRSFVDVGSGSGLFSLAARRLGARVVSFDYDPQSVACTAELKRRYFPDDGQWAVAEGSVLDKGFLDRLGSFDIVYSWGVLHHTGSMWQALDNVGRMVASEGLLFVAIYNDQGRSSRRWRAVKRAYVGVSRPLKLAVLLPALIRLWGPTIVRDASRGSPLSSWKAYGRSDVRGMDPWRDMVDWVGGYPFEVAKPEQVFDFFRERGFLLSRMKTCAGGLGCNEFVMARASAKPKLERPA